MRPFRSYPAPELLQHALAIVLGVQILLLAGCAVNPATGKRQFSLVSESQEISMGREADQQIVASLGLYGDDALQRYVRDLGMRMASMSERPELPWTFRVIDDPIVNAFALPGGFIYITRGILSHLNNEAELMGVLGHEIGHVTARHSVKRISQQQLAQIGLGIGMIIKPELQQFGELAGAGLGILFLKFGRDDENEADGLGVRYLRRVKYDPREMADVMTMLDRVTQAAGGGRIPEWLSTHPDPGNRREHIQEMIDTMTTGFAGAVVNEEDYLRQIDGMVFGQNPREGFFRGNTFLHPELKFQFLFPEGWQTANQKQAVLSISPQKDALIQITLSASKTIDGATRDFAAQKGVSADVPMSGDVHGLPSRSMGFSAQTEQGTLKGLVAFVQYEGNVYQLLAYSGQQGWSGYEAAARRALASFERLTDPRVLAVQPWRIKVVKLDRAMSLEQFNERYPSVVPIETLALINRVDPKTPVGAGQEIKRVIGEKLP